MFFLQTDEALLKNKLAATPSFEKVHNLIIAESGKIINLPVSQRILTGKRLLHISQESIRRISFLSYSYRMTDSAKYAQRAETEMLALAAFTNWNPDHFLDVAEMTLAMAIGYDWCYNYLSQASRTKIAAAIKAKGIRQATPDKPWLKLDNNWNQVCNAGISAGVAAVYDENPSYYQPLIDRAVNSIKIPMGVYKYNGAYPEGMGYWDYGTSFNILFIDMLQRMWNTDRGLISTNGFLKTVDFVAHMQGNGTKQVSGGELRSIYPLPFNFADCGQGFAVQPGMFWLAARTSDRSILYSEMKKLEFSLANNASSLTGNRLLPFLLIWGMNLNLTNLQPTTETTYMAQGKSAVAAMRSGWGSNDIYLAVKGGTPSANHAHMDIGSFVMEVNDIRWAADFGMSNYHNLETNGVDLWKMHQTSERWDVFRLNNMAHNTLTFNGKKQLVDDSVAIENLINTNELKSVSMNLTPVYKNEVNNYRRTASIVSNRYVEIKDEIKAGSSSLKTRWNLLTQAIPIKVSEKIIKLVQSTKTLYLILDGADDVKAKTWSTKPSTSYEEQNDGYAFAGFEFTIPAGASKTITVKLVPAGDPILDGLGLDLNSVGQLLNEDFEAFNFGTASANFVNYKGNPPTNGRSKAVLGEVVANPYKAGINTSEKVFRIKRQDDSDVINNNAGDFAYRGAEAFGYDLRVNSNSVIEFKYYKDAPGRIGIRLYDGVNGDNRLMLDYTDPNETTNGYTTAQWRTARFAVGKLNYSQYNFTASGYLRILLETNGTEPYQEKELVMYVDDVKMLSVKASQTITFSALSSKTYGDAPFALSGTSSAGLPLTYASGNTGVATVSGNMVTIVGVGTATITASQAGNNNYSPAADVAQSFTVNKANQTISFAPLPPVAVNSPAFALTATASSSLPIAYSTTSNNITLTNGSVGIVGAGRTTITATQPGNANYNAADPVSQSFCVNPAKPSIAISNLNTPNPTLTSSATEGNQWYLDGVAIAGATSTTYNSKKTGSYRVQVTVDGCTGELSDEQPVLITGIETGLPLVEVYPNPVTNGMLSISFGGMAGKKQVTLFALTGESLLSSSTESGSIEMDVANLSAGMYLARIVNGGVVQTKKFKKQ